MAGNRLVINRKTCVVLAGGLGLRLRQLTNGLVPKVLAPVNGEPFLAHKLRSLAAMGVTDVVLLTGELGEQVEQYVSVQSFGGMRVSCVPDGPTLLGTGGAIARAASSLPPGFWVTYGDSLMSTDLAAAEARRDALNLDAIVTVFQNDNQLQRSNMCVVGDLLTEYSKSKQDERFRWIDLGLLYFQRSAFETVSTQHPTDLVEVLAPLVAARRVLAWLEATRFWDIGTPQALRDTEQWLHKRNEQ